MSMRPEVPPFQVQRSLEVVGRTMTRFSKVLEVGSSISVRRKGKKEARRTMTLTTDGVKVTGGRIQNERGSTVGLTQRLTGREVFDAQRFEIRVGPVKVRYHSVPEA